MLPICQTSSQKATAMIRTVILELLECMFFLSCIIEVIIRYCTSDGLRILPKQGIQISGKHGLHLFAFHEYDAALRNCLYCYFFGYDIMVSDDLCRCLGILIDKIH